MKILYILLILYLLICISCASTKIGTAQQAANKGDLATTYSYINTENDYINREAAKALAKIQSEEILDYLFDMLYHEDAEIVKIAIDRLGDFKANTLVKNKLINLLSNRPESFKINNELLFILSNMLFEEDFIKYPGLSDDLFYYLNDNNDKNRIYSAKCFAVMGRNEGETIIEQFVLADYFFNKREALKVIGYYGNKKHIENLNKIVNEEKGELAQLANQAINLISQSDDNKKAERDYSKLIIASKGYQIENEFVDVGIRDANGAICAALIVYTNLDNLNFDSYNGIVKINTKPGKTILYLSPQEEVVEVYKTGILEPLKIILPSNDIYLHSGKVFGIKVLGVE